MTNSADAAVVRWPRIERADASLRPTRAEVDLGAIAHNLDVVRGLAAPAKVFAVIKADAYGHGAVPVAHRLERAGCDGFAVALAEEGIELRDAGVRSPILVMNGVSGGAHREMLARDLTPVVYDLGEAEAFHHATSRPIGIHLKIDTGMGRLGVPVDRLDGFLARLERFRQLRIDGLMTHLASAGDDDDFTAEQLRAFTRALHVLRARGHRPRTLHAANSAATIRVPSARYDLVRTGIALFGYSTTTEELPLRPAMRLHTAIVALRDVPVGGSVGYDRTFRAERPSRLATIPIGYADGLFRAVSNRGFVLVRGTRCPIAGNVSMDLTGIDVTDVPGVAVGDEVVCLGAQNGVTLDARDLAVAAQTLPYEVLTNVSRRVPRFYVD